MNLSKILKNGLLILVASLVLSACATQKSRLQVKCKAMFIQEQILLNI